jgi:hypothetical protein
MDHYPYQELKHLDDKKKAELGRQWLIFQERLENPPPEVLERLPFIGKTIQRYNDGQFLEALFFFIKTDDPVIDQKMLNAIRIRDYEMEFGLYSSLLWGGVFSLLPGLKGYNLSTRLVFGLVPFSLAYYRSFRRGYDQMTYVGSTYMEFLVKKRTLLEYLGTTDGYLSDVKQAIMKKRNYQEWLRVFGVKPYEKS